MEPLIHRRVGDHDVVVGDSTRGEKIDVFLRRISGIADGQGNDPDVARYQHANGTFDAGMSARPLKGLAVEVVNMGRPVNADRNRNVAGLEAGQPFVIDQHAVGRDRDRYAASGP